MRMIVTMLMLLSLVVLLTGCTTRTVTQHETQVAVPNDNLLQLIDVIPPPDRDDFVNASYDDKLLMLMGAYQDQTTALGVCNLQTEKLRNWKQRVIDKYKNKENTTIREED